MSTSIYQSEQMLVALACVECARCHQVRRCVHFYAMVEQHCSIFNLCLAHCWPEFCQAVDEGCELEEYGDGFGNVPSENATGQL